MHNGEGIDNIHMGHHDMRVQYEGGLECKRYANDACALMYGKGVRAGYAEPIAGCVYDMRSAAWAWMMMQQNRSL